MNSTLALDALVSFSYLLDWTIYPQPERRIDAAARNTPPLTHLPPEPNNLNTKASMRPLIRDTTPRWAASRPIRSLMIPHPQRSWQYSPTGPFRHRC